MGDTSGLATATCELRRLPPKGRPAASAVMAAAVLLLVFPAGRLAAETFYNKDGVQLSATARVIDPEAATCRIREERHTTEQYEKLKPNHGKPLRVWRVELVVANYSGKVLDYLSAHLNVESSWPPCDNWDGLGNYGKQVIWTGPLMSIQDVGSVAPGEERREIEFVLVFHDREPAFGRWDIDYDFTAAPPDGTGGSPAASPSESAPAEPVTATNAERPAADGGDQTDGLRQEDTCTGKAVGASCWMKVANQPGCYLWVEEQKEATATWTGRETAIGLYDSPTATCLKAPTWTTGGTVAGLYDSPTGACTKAPTSTARDTAAGGSCHMATAECPTFVTPTGSSWIAPSVDWKSPDYDHPREALAAVPCSSSLPARRPSAFRRTTQGHGSSRRLKWRGHTADFGPLSPESRRVARLLEVDELEGVLALAR